jgi:hypothetical protein
VQLAEQPVFAHTQPKSALIDTLSYLFNEKGRLGDSNSGLTGTVIREMLRYLYRPEMKPVQDRTLKQLGADI